MNTYRRIKQSPTNPKERPNINQQTKPIDKCCEDVLLTARPTVQNRSVTRLIGDHELAGKSKEEKHESADKLSTRRDAVSF
jgi:hypothetical protein